MAQIVTYTAAEKKKYKSWTWAGNNIAGSRAIKMRRPQCAECQQGQDTESRWWKKCEHDPYWSSQRKTRKVAIWEIDPATGEEVMVGEETKIIRRIRVPNIIEVPLIARSNDGRGPSRFHDQKGYLYMMEPDKNGQALNPMCEMHGCGKAWPTVKTARYGIYCSEGHARAAVADSQGSKTHDFAWIDNDLDEGIVESSRTPVTI